MAGYPSFPRRRESSVFHANDTGSPRARGRRQKPHRHAPDRYRRSSMEALLVSILVVAVGEIGDKTQLLALMLAARFRNPVPIVLGIAVATLFNHTLAGVVGAWVRHVVPD